MIQIPKIERFFITSDLSVDKKGDNIYQRLAVRNKDKTEAIAVGPNLDVRCNSTAWLWGEWKENGQFHYSKGGDSLTPSKSAAKSFLVDAMQLSEHIADQMVSAIGSYSISELWYDGEKSNILFKLKPEDKALALKQWARFKPLRESLMFLNLHLGANWWRSLPMAVKFSNSLYEKLEENPYFLMGEMNQHNDRYLLKKIDNMVRRLCPERSFKQYRAEALLLSAISTVSNNGHTLYPFDSIVKKVIASEGASYDEIQLQQCALQSEHINVQALDDGHVYVVFQESFNAEKYIYAWAEEKNQITASPYIEEATALIKRDTPTITDEQLAAAISPLVTYRTLLSGGPGTGKSKTIESSIKAFYVDPANRYKKTLLVAPTGKASDLLMDVYQSIGAHRFVGPPSTIEHALKYYTNDNNILDIGYMVCDEASMIDVIKAQSLFSATRENTRTLIVGDQDQLPSIGAGEMFRDLFNLALMNTCELTQNWRFSKDSGIGRLAQRFKSKQPVEHHETHTFGEDLEFHFASTVDGVRNALQEEIKRYLAQGVSPQDITIISPKRIGMLGVDSLNDFVSPLLNKDPGRHSKAKMTDKLTLAIGDRIIHLQNEKNKNLVNGSMGKVINTTRSNHCEALFENGERLTYNNFNASKVELAYSLTAHKSQGSQYDVVILLGLKDEHKNMIQKRILYTGLTRAKKQFSFIGDLESLNSAILDTNSMRRTTLGSVLYQVKQTAMDDSLSAKPEPIPNSAPNTKTAPNTAQNHSPISAANEPEANTDNPQTNVPPAYIDKRENTQRPLSLKGAF